MDYYISKNISDVSIEQVEQKVIEKLKENGFGVVTYLDVSATLKAKIGAGFTPYRILGACSPHHALAVLSQNDKVGVMLPCNVCIEQKSENTIEVFSINPLAVMGSIGSPELLPIAEEITEKLLRTINSL